MTAFFSLNSRRGISHENHYSNSHYASANRRTRDVCFAFGTLPLAKTRSFHSYVYAKTGTYTRCSNNCNTSVPASIRNDTASGNAGYTAGSLVKNGGCHLRARTDC